MDNTDRKTLLLLLFSVVFVLSIIYLISILRDSQNTTTLRAQINGATIYLEETKKKQQQELGLGSRASLESNHGMIFIFDPPTKPSFWMKGMKFPLDFIWMRDDKVVDLSEHIAAPLSAMSDNQLPIISPNVEIDAVIEVNAGFVEYNKINIGDDFTMMK